MIHYDNKELARGLRILKRSAWIFQIHPYSSPSLTIGLLSSLCCFDILVSYYFYISFNWKLILFMAKVTQNTMTEFFHLCRPFHGFITSSVQTKPKESVPTLVKGSLLTGLSSRLLSSFFPAICTSIWRHLSAWHWGPRYKPAYRIYDRENSACRRFVRPSWRDN